MTAADGSYRFENLPAGAYAVAVDAADLPAGMVPTADLDGTTTPHVAVVTLGAGQTRLDADFGYTGVGSIGDELWLDRDGDGAPVPAADDPRLGGVDVTVIWAGPDGVFGNPDDVAFASTTDPSGRYLVERLPFGSYRVVVDPATLPDGLAPSYDADGVSTPGLSEVVLAADDPGTAWDERHRHDQDFAFAGTGSIGDLVWHDADGDGVLGAGETGIGGVALSVIWFGPDGVLGTPDDVAFEATTAPDGSYHVGNLPAGSYEVWIDPATVPDGFVAVYDVDGALGSSGSSGGDGIAVVALAPGEARDDVDFGYQVQADLAITKTHDGDLVVGANATFTITVHNLGPALAAAPVITDVLSAGLTYRAAVGDGVVCDDAGSAVTCTATGPLAAGAELVVLVTVDVLPAAAPSVRNTATVASPTVDPNPANDTAVDTADVPLADLELTKELDGGLVLGEEATYLLTVTNHGPSVARGPIEVVDELPEGLELVRGESVDAVDGWSCALDGSSVRCTRPDDMPLGSSAVRVIVTVTAAVGSDVENRADVAGITELLGTGGRRPDHYVDPQRANDAASAMGTVERPRTGPLAYTGRDVVRFVVFGAGLVAIGMLLVTAAFSRRRRTDPAVPR